LASGFTLNLLIPRGCIFGPGNSNRPSSATLEDYSSKIHNGEKNREASLKTLKYSSSMLLLYICLFPGWMDFVNGCPETAIGHTLDTILILFRILDTHWTLIGHFWDTLWTLYGQSPDSSSAAARWLEFLAHVPQ